MAALGDVFRPEDARVGVLEVGRHAPVVSRPARTLSVVYGHAALGKGYDWYADHPFGIREDG